MGKLFEHTVFALALMLAARLSVASAQSEQTPSTSTPGFAKVAWVDLEQAILSCNDGKRELGEIQKFTNKKNSDLEAHKKELLALRNQLKLQKAKLNDKARADLEEQIESKDTLLQRFQQDTQKEIDTRRARVMRSIGRKMAPIIETIAKEKGLSFVLYLNSSIVAWTDPKLVITEDVIAAYNQASGAASPKD